MDGDLIFIQRVRDNLLRAEQRAKTMYMQGLIEGAIIVIHVVDVYKDPTKRNRRHQLVHTELYHIGDCASEEFQHNLLHHTSSYHKSLIRGKQNISFGRWQKADTAIARVQTPLDDERVLDTLLTVWGGEVDDQNKSIVSLIANNL